jgi:hypothetical protein
MNIKNRILKGHYFRLFLMVTLMSGFFYACSPEKKLAKEFVFEHPKRYAMVIPPDFLYKYNRNEWLLDSVKGNFTEAQKDSILWEMSKLVKDIEDSIYILKFTRGYEYQLADYGFDVFTPASIDLFMEKDSEAYVITIPQIELEETFYPYKDETVIDGYTYFHQHYLNALSVSTWFEITKVNDTSQNHKVLYAGDIMTDDLKSSFDYDVATDQVRYFYQIDTLNANDVYQLALILGKRYAQYTFDWLMNKYILEHKNPGDTLNYYWHYDVKNNKFYHIWDDENKFIPVE